MAPTSASDGFRLSFGIEELAVLVNTLGNSTLMGMGESPLVLLADHERQLVEQAATHSLLARGYLAPLETGELGIDETVKKILVMALRPNHIVTQVQSVFGRESATYHYLIDQEQITITHHAHLGVHHLDVTFERPNFVAAIFEKLAPFLPQATSASLTLLPTHALREVKALATSRAVGEALVRLIQNDMPRHEAQRFVEALDAPELEWFIYVASWQGEHVSPYEKALTILCRKGNCWSLQGESTGAASDMTILQPLSRSLLQSQLQSAFSLL